jgi:TRAP transporter TAXI family solute receptor
MAALLARLLAFVALAIVLPTMGRAGEPHWPATLVIGTASAGGTYEAYGEGLARLLTRELDLIVSTRATEGPAENLQLLETGAVQLAFVTQGVAVQGWNGTGRWADGRQFRALRVMFPMYDTPFQFMVLADSPVQSVAELAGKRIGIGPAGGTGGTYLPQMFGVLKVEAPLVTDEWAALARQLLDRKIDALAVAAGVPFPSFGEIERQAKVRYLPLSQRDIVELRLAMPELGVSSVPAGSYPTLRRLYPTVGLFNFAVAHRDLPDDLVFRIVDLVYRHQAELIEATPAAAETNPSNLSRNSFLPFHGGAARWYRNRSASGVVSGD